MQTRFPPEPNGYLHIGHAKSICLNFGLAAEFGGKTNLRFDDTNPEKEEQEYVDSIMDNVRWLGFDWEDRIFYASDYFDQLYDWALQLIRAGKAYVCDLTAEEMRKYRGTLTEPGKESPYRNRSVEENLDLFERMRAGEFPDGSRTLRAKIDMASPNLNMRDPVMYRILHAEHHRTGNEWCIYPMYDFAHGQSDSIEGITHSICTLEFEDHRPLYDWYIEQLGIYHPQQIEFDRLNLTYTLLSKRKLLQLVRERSCARLGRSAHAHAFRHSPPRLHARSHSQFLQRARRFENQRHHRTAACWSTHVREDLNKRAPRMMAVLQPLRVVIDNYPEGQVGRMEAVNNPEDPSAGTRKVPFSRVLYIEQDDFREDPPKQYYRLSPGSEVRLRWGYFITCTSVVKDEKGEVDRDSLHLRSGDARRQCAGRAQGEIHHPLGLGGARGRCRGAPLRHAVHARRSERRRGRISREPQSESLEVLTGCKLEPALGERRADGALPVRAARLLLRRSDTAPGKPVFNRTVALRDTWAKIEKRGTGAI